MELLDKAKHAWQSYRVVRAVGRHPLHRGRRVRSMLRWLRLSLASHLAPTRQITIPYVDGAVLHWPAESTSVMICARYGLGEYHDMAFCLHLLRPADLFCDVGANAGVYTILAAKAVGCSVVAAEPVPRTFDLLMQNVYANGVSERVDALRIGIGREPSALHFTSTLWSYNHVAEEPGENTIEVKVLPLDHVLGHRVPRVIKIDVEGFEAEVLAGATRTLSHPELQAVLLEMSEAHVQKYGSSLQSIRDALRAAGLSGPLWYDPAGRMLIPAGAPGDRRYNQIFVRDTSFVADRLTTARQYQVNDATV